MGDPGETDRSGQITHSRCESGVLHHLVVPSLGSLAWHPRCQANQGLVSASDPDEASRP
jgi:hypothetical protein